MDDFTRPFDLGQLAILKDLLPKEKLIELRKIINKTNKESQHKSKRECCFYCNEPCSSFCNSHTVPRFCLEYIATNGKLSYINTIVDVPFLNYDKGINEAGTFHIICRNCDNTIFQDYENEKNYDKIPTTKMLAQIAMKCNLKLISKREFENAFYDEIHSQLKFPEDVTERKQTVNGMDLKEYITAYNKAKKSSLKPFDGDYHIYSYINLPYRIPIAFQGSISLISDLEGNIINDIYNLNKNYEIKDVYLCVFPLKSKSIIMFFIENGNKRYSTFFKQFKKLTLPEQLKVVNYIIFAYTEDYFMSPKLSKDTTAKLINAARKSPDLVSLNPFANGIDTATEHFSFTEMNSIPNILSEEYQIKEEADETTI